MTSAPRAEMRATGIRLTRASTFSLILLACSIVASPSAAIRPTGPLASKEVFEKLILARIQAYGRGDFGSYARLVEPDFVHISDMGSRRTGKQLEPYVLSGKSNSTTFSVRDLSFKVRGRFAVVDSEVIATDPLVRARMRELDVFEARGSRWAYVAHSETIVQEKDIGPTSTAPDALQQYVGRYILPGGRADILTVSHGQLFGQDASGSEATPLIPITRDAFVVAGDPSITIFERNGKGVVTGYALRFGNGRVIRATKTK